jgi:hypothetical protein
MSPSARPYPLRFLAIALEVMDVSSISPFLRDGMLGVAGLIWNFRLSDTLNNLSAGPSDGLAIEVSSSAITCRLVAQPTIIKQVIARNVAR